ncbi:hypothetical protein M436DRAFT_83702 [Aureobasidium namibiae CBS 147.97]|uniref:Uncharacterized protein n=1 Tax=Aureobasidium namibiae CBS 147.97 TaxID=1043004 RepID=A0A074X9W8_9PEZI
MASAVPAELGQAKYHRPIHGSHNPTPVKQTSQKALQSITQVPRSPSISQRPLLDHVSQKGPESIVHDSLEDRPPAPARPPRPLLDFLEESVPIETRQLKAVSYEKDVIALGPSAQPPVIAQNSLEVPLREHSSCADHAIEEDSFQVLPQNVFSEKNTTSGVLGKGQLRTSSSKHAVTANETQSDLSVHVSTNSDDDSGEELQDCITVRSQPIDPSAKSSSRVAKTPDQVPLAFREAEENQSAAPLEPTRSFYLGVSAPTSLTTPNMPPKGSTAKATTSKPKKSAGTTSKKSFKPAPPLPDIVNQGETSAAAILRQRKAGGTSQSNTTKQASAAALEAISKTGASQKISARPPQVPPAKSSTKTTTKPTQQHPQRLPTKQPSRKIETPADRGEFELSPDPDVEQSAEPSRLEKGNSKQTKATKTVAASKNGNRSQLKKQAAKVPDTDRDDDDEDYSAPKSQKSRAAPTTRASTRAQTKKANRDDGFVESAPETTTSDAMRTQKRVSQNPSSTDREKEEIEDSEESVTHINSVGASQSQLATRAQPAKPPEPEQAKPRRKTQMMQALTSPDRATISTATEPRINQEAPAAHTYSSSAYRPMPKQGTTHRNPVSVNDDKSNDDDEDAINQDYDASFNHTIPEVMSQKPQEELKTPLIVDQTSKSGSADAHSSAVQQSLAHLSKDHSDLDLLAQERAQRKPNLVSFSTAGPRNQGTRAMRKDSSPDMHRLPSAEVSSPNLDQCNLEDPPDNYSTGLDMPTKKSSGVAVTGTSAHAGATSPTYKAQGNVFKSEPDPPTGYPDEIASITEVPIAKTKASKGSGMSLKTAIPEDRHTSARLARDAADDGTLVVNRTAVETGAQTGFLEDLVGDPSRRLPWKPEVLRKDTVAANPSVSLGEPRILTKSSSSKDLAPVSSEHPGSANQTLALPTPIDTQAPPRINPRPIDRSAERKAGQGLMPPAQETEERAVNPRLEAKQTEPLGTDRKRPPAELTRQPAKHSRTSTFQSRTQLTRSPAAKDPVLRRSSQVADNGSPIPYGTKIPPDTVQSPRTRDERMSATPVTPPSLTRQPVDDPFAQVTRFKHKEAVRSESSLEEMGALQENLPAQSSPAITHAGFDEDTQATAESRQPPEPQKKPSKNTVPEPQQDSPPKVQATQRMLGLMEALRSEVVPQTDTEAADGDEVEDTGAEEAGEGEDPDKTLVNEESVDADDDDGDDSESSSDTDDEGDKPKSGFSMWRNALEFHQGNVYDQLVRIAHRLTEHLKDHETAIKDISSDYKQDGENLIERLEKSNQARLEQYCTKRSKMHRGLVLGYEKVSGIMEKDKKDIKASRERHVKILQRQVDAERRLEQILQTYHL